AGRLWYRFASGAPLPDDVARRLASVGANATALAKAMFTDPAFAGTTAGLVKQPVEWAVGAMRQLGIQPSQVPAAARTPPVRGITALGQTLFTPPSVGGWPAGAAWLSTSATEHRVALAALLAAQAGPAARQAASSIDGLARLLVVDGFTDRTRAVHSGAGKDTTRLLTLVLPTPEYP